jgi:hypothetical protein
MLIFHLAELFIQEKIKGFLNIWVIHKGFYSIDNAKESNYIFFVIYIIPKMYASHTKPYNSTENREKFKNKGKGE